MLVRPPASVELREAVHEHGPVVCREPSTRVAPPVKAVVASDEVAPSGGAEWAGLCPVQLLANRVLPEVRLFNWMARAPEAGLAMQPIAKLLRPVNARLLRSFRGGFVLPFGLGGGMDHPGNRQTGSFLPRASFRSERLRVPIATRRWSLAWVINQPP